ncbi:MAG: bifunctional ADP-heptose synthase [Bacteroidales bacterium]
MTKNTLPGLLDVFSKLKVLIIGDVMVDSYIWGHVTRISPEAPVPVVAQGKSEYRMGGAANVARNVKSLGAEPVLCTVIGEDTHGEIFKSLLQGEGMTNEGIVETNRRITTVKTRIISGSQHLLRVDHEMEDYLEPQLENILINRIKSVMNTIRPDAVIFQDYDKGVITRQVIDAVILLAGEKKIPVLVDPKKRNFAHYHGATLFKPNFKELTEGLNIHIDKKDFNSLYNAAQVLHKKNAHRFVMVTLSELGMLISEKNSYHIMPAVVRDIADVSGAGDTVIATAALCLAAGLSPKQTAALSNLAGGLVCEKVGVVPIEKEILLKENFTIPEE